MCIRDSKYTITAWTDKDTIEKVTKQITKKIDAVSYTHLDVYKRQVYMARNGEVLLNKQAVASTEKEEGALDLSLRKVYDLSLIHI